MSDFALSRLFDIGEKFDWDPLANLELVSGDLLTATLGALLRIFFEFGAAVPALEQFAV